MPCKRVLRQLVFPLLAAGCQTLHHADHSHSWVAEQGRMYCYGDRLCPSMMLEIIQNERDSRVYLNLLSFALNADGGVKMILKSGEERQEGVADCFLGGQRLLLQKEAGAWVIEKVSQKKEIVVRLGHLQERFVGDEVL